jgi:hypothetical protein
VLCSISGEFLNCRPDQMAWVTLTKKSGEETETLRNKKKERNGRKKKRTSLHMVEEEGREKYVHIKEKK